MESMNWNVTREFHKESYGKPVGCAFSSNDKYSTIFENITVDQPSLACISESKNPEARRLKAKYSVSLSEEFCVDTDDYELVLMWDP